MRSFRCYDCGHQFQMAHGAGSPGAQMTCPNCGSRNVHRAENDRGYARAGRGRGRGGLGRGRRWVQ